jgi:hypothetical protein
MIPTIRNLNDVRDALRSARTVSIKGYIGIIKYAEILGDYIRVELERGGNVPTTNIYIRND